LPQQPVGPRPNGIPILIGGNGPKGQRHAARHADIYSCYAEERAHIDELGPRLRSLDAICAEIGRDPATLERSAGVLVNPLERLPDRPDVISGSAQEIAGAVRSLRDGGFTRVEMMFSPGTMAALEALAPVVDLLDGD
jgi:alkanesulfonate monooxygenase SsuD/methylene tetrahydromethanopterin reductase-like flavin-dependent oxidoreductase (luciferase family)